MALHFYCFHTTPHFAEALITLPGEIRVLQTMELSRARRTNLRISPQPRSISRALDRFGR